VQVPSLFSQRPGPHLPALLLEVEVDPPQQRLHHMTMPEGELVGHVFEHRKALQLIVCDASASPGSITKASMVTTSTANPMAIRE
jgi:hypothetical protein